jgi:hypothetical protein
MRDSWRDILERAAENLSIDLDRESRLRQQSGGWPAPRRVSPPPFALAYLLERERAERLQDLPVHEPRHDRKQARQASPQQSKAGAAQRSEPQKKGPLGEFAPAAISVAIVALTVYAIYNLLH